MYAHVKERYGVAEQLLLGTHTIWGMCGAAPGVAKCLGVAPAHNVGVENNEVKDQQLGAILASTCASVLAFHFTLLLAGTAVSGVNVTVR